MRLLIYLALCACMGACVPPIDLEIPDDHPANPQAGMSPSTPGAEYRYRLPHPFHDPAIDPEIHGPTEGKDPSRSQESDMDPTSGGHHGH